ncbi:MAG: hypothetical protein K9H49_07430 [Bacteroidales bacterium]|nr:hypothetical protein [Bacteroidales bacterium]MCF8390343.1 hypothetical protein [Bacteroidales bacterium]
MEDEIFSIKKEMVTKEYDSLFDVYGRETNIVFNFRSWTITLLSGYYGLLMATNMNYSTSLFLALPLFIILLFLLLEVAERSVMLNLLEELRSLEKIFMETDMKKLKKKINKYEFRDIRDSKLKMTKKITSFFKAFLTPQVLSWYPILILFNILITIFILSQKQISQDVPVIGN